MSSSRVALLLGVVLLFSACDLNDGTLSRATGEYFPLVAGTEWTYMHPDGTTSKVQVRGDSFAWNYPCKVLEYDFQEQYVSRRYGEVHRFVNRMINIGGTDYPLEQRYGLYYVLPFVSGNSWSDVFEDRVVVLGDTFLVRHEISGKVDGDTTISVQAGEFTECYQVDLNEVIVTKADTTRVITQEWFAPNIGLVKRIQDTIQTSGTDLQEDLYSYEFP